MNIVRTFQQELEDIARLWEAEDYSSALDRVEEARRAWPGNSHLHILRASLIQLQDQPRDSLDEAKEALRLAIDLDEFSPVAAIELGHYLDHVEDDPSGAEQAYAQGIGHARRQLIDGSIGRAQALLQLDRPEQAFPHVAEALHLLAFEADSVGGAKTWHLCGALLAGMDGDSRPATAEQVATLLDEAILRRSG